MKLESLKKVEIFSLRAVIVTVSIILGALLFYVFHWKNLGSFLNTINFGEPLFADFDRHYYPMGKVIFATKFPVPGYFYTPLFAIIMHFFSKLDLETSRLLWGVVQVVLLLKLCFVSGLYFSLRAKKEYYFYISTLMFVLSMPILHGFRWGQISVLLVLLIISSMLFYKNGNKLTAAFLLALGAGIKYYPAVFLIYFILKRDIKFVIAFLFFMAGFLYVIPGLSLGFDHTIAFYRFVKHFIAEAVTWLPKAGDSQYIAHVLYRVTGELNTFPFKFFKYFGILIFAINTAVGYLLSREKKTNDIVIFFSFIFMSFPFIISTSWPHYFSYLPFCQMFVFYLFMTNRRNILGNWLALIPLVISVILSSSLLFIYSYTWVEYSYKGILFLSNLFLLIGLYWITSCFYKEKSNS